MASAPTLPAAYRWLLLIALLPRMLAEALKLYGITEIVGPKHNPVIMGWGDELGPDRIGYRYAADEVAWCGLLVAIAAHRAGKGVPAGPLYALNWATFGDAIAQRAALDVEKPLVFRLGKQASLGDVLVFRRPGGGHVGLYVGEDALAYHVLGGNQGNSVSILRIAKARCVAVRRPPMTVPPASVKPVHLAAAGALSRNEA